MKKILVTGGSGYKGSVLIPRLLKKGFRVLSIDTNWFGDNLNVHPNLQKEIIDIRKLSLNHFEGVDVVIHLANIANDPSVELDPLLSWEINVLTSQKIAELSKRRKSHL